MLAAGLIVLARRNGMAAGVLVALPIVLVVAASALRRYPLGVPRMMVFAAPLWILMAAGALSAVASRLRAHARPAVPGGGGTPVPVAPGEGARPEAQDPPQGEDARTLVAAFRERPASGEAVYVAARGIPSWVFYTTNWEKPDRDRLAFYARAASHGPSFENAPSRARPVVDEGSDLVYYVRGRRPELLGIATGRQWRWPSFVTASPDEGWAANEARRIAGAADPCAWMYFTHLSGRGEQAHHLAPARRLPRIGAHPGGGARRRPLSLLLPAHSRSDPKDGAMEDGHGILTAGGSEPQKARPVRK